jgi:hypothetical protein
LPNIIEKSNQGTLIGSVEGRGEMRNAYTILLGKL